jgi:hypothetical protein
VTRPSASAVAAVADDDVAAVAVVAAAAAAAATVADEGDVAVEGDGVVVAAAEGGDAFDGADDGARSWPDAPFVDSSAPNDVRSCKADVMRASVAVATAVVVALGKAEEAMATATAVDVCLAAPRTTVELLRSADSS